MATWSIKSSGGDFTSLGAAVADAGVVNGDTLSVDEAFVCQGSTLTLNKSLTITASGTFGVTTPTYAEAISKARISVAGSGSAIVVSPGASGCVIENLGIFCSTGSNAVEFNETGRLSRFFLYANGNGAFCLSSGKTMTLSNGAVVLHSGNVPIGAYTAAGTCEAYQVSLLNEEFAGFASIYADSGGTVNCYGVIARNLGDAPCWRSGGGGFTFGGDGNVSSDGTAIGSAVRTNFVAPYKDAGTSTEDFNLYGLNGGLLQGVPDSSGACGDVATDIAGNARPLAASFPIDPGCAQIASGPSVMAYADAGAVVTPGSSTLAISINVPSSNCRMLVFASGRGAGVSSCDWNGTAIAQIANTAKNDGTMFTEAWDLASPGTGTHNVSVVFSGSASRIWAAVVVLKYAGATAAAAVDVSGGNAAGHTTTLTTTNDDAGGIDIEAESADTAPTPTAPSVLLGKTSSGSFNYPRLSTYLPGTAGSKTMVWSGGDVQSVVYLKPGSGGGGATNVVSACFLL